MGLVESGLAIWLGYFLLKYMETNDLGRVYGPDAPFGFRPKLIRLPDVSFSSHGRIPRGEERKKPVATWAPELVVEILSKTNSKKEIDRKLGEFFAAGVELAWIVDPRKKTVAVYTDATTFSTLGEKDHLDGGMILPGFTLLIREWFAKID